MLKKSNLSYSNWKIKNNIFYIEYFKKCEITGGKLIKTSGGSCATPYALIDGQRNLLISNSTESFTISEISKDKKFQMDTAKFGRKLYWKFCSDPGMLYKW